MSDIKPTPEAGKPKIIFLGTPDFAVPALKELINAGYPIQAVFTSPDKPTGRKQILTQSPVKELAIANRLRVVEAKTLKDDSVFELFKSLEPELCIIVAYGRIIPQRYIDVPKYGFINIHPSVLPRYRGPSPMQSAILNGDKETGVSLMLIDQEVDHGPILFQSFHVLIGIKTYPQLSDELSALGAKALIKILPDYIYEKIKPHEQDHSKATFTKMFDLEDGHIDWSKSADEISNQIRALNPEPGTWTTWQDKKLKILTASPLVDISPSGAIGLVINLNDQISVVTSKGNLLLETIQLEGSKPTTATEFINGHKDFIGSKLQ